MRVVLPVVLIMALAGFHPGLQGAAQAGDSFTIVSEDATTTSRVVHVRIAKRMTREALARIAQNIKAGDANPQTRHTLVSFFLPRMPLNQRPWASVDTTPVTKVLIAGLQLEEQQQLAAEFAEEKRAIVGSWLTDLPSVPGRITIFNDKGKTYLEWAQRGGTKSLDEVTVKGGSRGTRFELKAGGDDFYVLKGSGVLELRGEDRLIAVAERLAPGRPGGVVVSSTSLGNEARADGQEVYGPAASESAEAAPAVTVKSARVRKRRVVKRTKDSRNSRTSAFVTDYRQPLSSWR